MANIIDNLNILNTNLDNAKFKIAKNLKDKGVQALPSDKLDMLADKIVDIPSGSCNLQELSVTENGVYTPQAGDVKGFSKITVNVPTGGAPSIRIIKTGKWQSETPVVEGTEMYSVNDRDNASVITIMFSGIPDFEIYLKCGEYGYSDSFLTCYNLDSENLFYRTDSTNVFQKVSYPNDGKVHYIYIDYHTMMSHPPQTGYVYWKTV